MPFEFKQFYINDDLCAQKVCTDSILLGSWVPVNSDERVLDIGCGCGLLGIMLAQRTSGNISVDGVEIDKYASTQAKNNVANSPWPLAVSIIEQDINLFNPATKYDLIISNPPYFNQSLKGPNRARNQARHSDGLSYQQLLASVIANLAENGRFCVVLPFDGAEQLKTLAKDYQLSVFKCVEVKSVERKQAKLQLICFVRRKALEIIAKQRLYESIFDGQLTIHDTNGDYSCQFIALTKNFYLNR